jgi:hypothetical protein
MRCQVKKLTAQSAWVAYLLLTLGCGEARPEQSPAAATAPVPLSSLFDPTSVGTIRGTVGWSGDLPKVPPFEIRFPTADPDPPRPRLIRENPNAPIINAESKGVAGAVVFLRKVDPRQARPWDHPAVIVEHRDRQLFVLQGEARAHVGFLHQGDTIFMVSRESAMNILQAGGNAFFSLPFPDPNQPLTRALPDRGVVELTSGVGYYWMRCYLFVSDHPYFARTDSQGHFDLQQVPPGKYQLVCWMPNWQPKSQDRDPESAMVTRMFFHPPLEVERKVVVESAKEARVDFTISAEQFPR